MQAQDKVTGNRLISLGLPPDYVQALDAVEAGRLVDLPPAAPAWFYPAGGWVDQVAVSSCEGKCLEIRIISEVAAAETSAWGQVKALYR